MMPRHRPSVASPLAALGLLTLTLGLALSLALAPAAAGAPDSGLRVALTFDDLPLTGNPECDPDLARRVTAALTGYLEKHSIPAAGLVTPGQECLTPDVLAETYRRWREVGAVLGNHTATHPDYNHTAIAAYLADLDRGQDMLDTALGEPQGERWFRPPMLHSGDTAAKKRALAEHLEERGYRVAPVTIDNQEWVYAAVYTDARRRGDDALAQRVAGAYLEHLEEAFAFYEDLSRAVFDRQIPQTLLLHANLLNAERLGEVVAMLEGRGYSFVGLPEAVADPAYERRDTYVGPRGLSWLQRWAMADGVEFPPEPREAQWVAEARREIGARAERGEEATETTEETAADTAADAMSDTTIDARSAILAASAAFSRAYVEGDMETLAGLYTEDAALLPPELPADEVLRGREAAANYFAPSPGRRNLAHTMRPDDLRIEGAVAIDTGVWTNLWQREAGAPRRAEGRYLVVWRRGEDGRWRIAYDMWHRPQG